MRLYPVQKEVVLYEEGFGDDDLLQRKRVGERISELLERVEDPLVMAVDGPWGSGKSFFLKRWVGAHKVENSGSATTVYFDAFANDYLDDPLIALTGAIDERLPAEKSQESWKKAKKVAVTLIRPVLRIGAAVVTAGATEVTGPILDAAIQAGGKQAEEAAEAFWRREDGRRAAMIQFRSALGELTKDGTPLVIVVDELDRCRPDYALSVLEVIKHFFAVERVHFVLGVNLEALEQIVRARYGAGVDAADYLKRFVSLSLQLPQFVGQSSDMHAPIKYLLSAGSTMGIHPKALEIAAEQIKLAVNASRVSLRDIDRVLTRLALLPQRKAFGDFYRGYQTVIISLILWQVVRPEFFHRALNQSLEIDEIETFFGISKPMLDDKNPDLYIHDAYILSGIWRYALSGTAQKEEDRKAFAKTFDTFGRASKILPKIERDFFDLFEVTGT
ncbi:KAP family P-loop NTPase fold protein [Agrobacterium salinitolerans]|uniref:P-loop NTPase fold protein n=1 Tax=Agrobacterium salinitolerans TaxID=1183413 RepID=A0A9X3KK58_9HYPH|nr:P-loop NTPase fold protein [Agrobacterium salinitolerans]MCZ7936334.1 P-loop NTPase fold protein [Agrobacterium salinitolerans]